MILQSAGSWVNPIGYRTHLFTHTHRHREHTALHDTTDDDRSPQIFNRYEGKDSSKHKRNLVITGGVALSVIVSPVVAAVTVGKLN